MRLAATCGVEKGRNSSIFEERKCLFENTRRLTSWALSVVTLRWGNEREGKERRGGDTYIYTKRIYEARLSTLFTIIRTPIERGERKSITCVNALLQGEKPPALFTVIQTYIHSGKIVLKHTSLHFHRATFTQEVHEEMSRTLACRACPCRIQMHPWYAIGNAISERNNYSSKRLCYERSLRTMLLLCARH